MSYLYDRVLGRMFLTSVKTMIISKFHLIFSNDITFSIKSLN